MFAAHATTEVASLTSSYSIRSPTDKLAMDLMTPETDASVSKGD